MMAGSQPTAQELRSLTCDTTSPKSDVVLRRTRCNRPSGHDGPCRHIRARDFKVMAEWTGQDYTILPGGKVVAR